jgi:hypothetical protein
MHRARFDFAWTSASDQVSTLHNFSGPALFGHTRLRALKGARTLIHPSVAVQNDVANAPGIFFQPLPIGDDERANKVNITHEINYLGRRDEDLYKGVHRA